MSVKLIRDGVILSAVVLGGFWMFTHRPAVYAFLGVEPADFVKTNNPAEPTPQKAQEINPGTLSGSAYAIKKSSDGQYWAVAQVNRSNVKFLVDTGASVIALTPGDAKRIGVPMQSLNYTSPVNTAGGKIMAAPTTISKVSLGNIRVKNVRAVVIPEGLSHSLLGMSFLGELQRVEAHKNVMILRQ